MTARLVEGPAIKSLSSEYGDGEYINIKIEWDNNKSFNRTLVAVMSETEFDEDMIGYAYEDYPAIWRDSCVTISTEYETSSYSGFPWGERPFLANVLLLNLDSDFNVVSHTIVQITEA